MIDYQKFTNKNMSVGARRALDVGDIWANQIKCNKCGDIIRSTNRHDYRECSCGAVAVDGGSWYGRRIGNPEDWQEMIEYFDYRNDGDELLMGSTPSPYMPRSGGDVGGDAGVTAAVV